MASCPCKNTLFLQTYGGGRGKHKDGEVRRWVHGWAAKREQAAETSREAGEVERGSNGMRVETVPGGDPEGCRRQWRQRDSTHGTSTGEERRKGLR